MAPIREPNILSNVSEIADKIRFARSDETSLGKVVFLIGAGCSISAGIPGAVDIAKSMVARVAHKFECLPNGASCVEAYKCLIENKYFDRFAKNIDGELSEDSINWYKIYDEMFCRYYSTPDDVRELFDNLVSDADGAINWAHLCLGEIVARRYVSTVLTTNFDQLILSGMARAGILPVVCDGIESLNRIAGGVPRHPQLIELHGSRHTYLLRNAPEDVEALRNNPQATAAIRNLLKNAKTFVVVGYGGREEGVMNLLIEAAQVYGDKNLYWVNYSPHPEEISDKVREFLATSKNARLFPGQDADKFFLELCKSLKIGAPRAISQPLYMVDRAIKELSKSKVIDKDIQAEITDARKRAERLNAMIYLALTITTPLFQKFGRLGKIV